jgi:hypothetical protein
LTKWAKVWYEISMEDPLYRFPILSQYVDKHGRHKQFLFLVGQILKIFSSETIWPNKATFHGKHLWKVLYEITPFHPDWTKHVCYGQSLFLIVRNLKNLETMSEI